MNPSTPTQDIDFGPSVEMILLVLGVVLTIVLVGVAIWLFRTMRREDREARRESEHGGDS